METISFWKPPLKRIVAARLISGHISQTEEIEIERIINTEFVCSGLNFEKVIFFAIGPTIIKSRTININKIKDKEERKYWRELEKINRIPDIYKSNQEIKEELKSAIKNNNLGGL